jgi:hypothetical protein
VRETKKERQRDRDGESNKETESNIHRQCERERLLYFRIKEREENYVRYAGTIDVMFIPFILHSKLNFKLLKHKKNQSIVKVSFKHSLELT